MKYIQNNIAGKRKGCVFCQAHRSKDDKKWHVVMRNKTCFVMLNTFPYNNGHLMVIPNRHVASFELLQRQEMLDLDDALVYVIRLLKRTIKPDGFNMGMNLGSVGGAGIADHIHMHVVPRWMGDSNFMPVVAGTKVISQSLDELYAILKKSRKKK